MNLFLHMKVHVKVHVKVHLEALPNYARCSDDLAPSQYRLAHAVLMVVLQPIDSMLWVVTRFGLKTESDEIEFFKLPDEPQDTPLSVPSFEWKKKVHLKLHMNLHMKVIFV